MVTASKRGARKQAQAVWLHLSVRSRPAPHPLVLWEYMPDSSPLRSRETWLVGRYLPRCGQEVPADLKELKYMLEVNAGLGPSWS